MKKVNDIKVELFRVEGDITPFVEVDYMDKSAQEHHGLMMIDSGCTSNFLCGHMHDRINEMCWLKETTDNIETISGDPMSADNVHFSFALGNRQFSETFCISNINIPNIKGCTPVIGLIGNIFLQKYRLAIDYTNFTLHTSHVSPNNLSIADCSFFFPMEIGLRNYGVPVLYMVQNETEVVALADTGASSNMFSAKALKEDGFHCKYLGTSDTMEGAVGSIEVKDAIIDFSLVTLNGNNTEDLPRHGNFKISSYNIIDRKESVLDENGQPLEPVEAIIGAPFMANEGWILDFGAKIIYRPKGFYKWSDNMSVRVSAHNDVKMNDKDCRRIHFFTDATETGMPFIRISTGSLKGVIMLIDTGSTNNALFGKAYYELKDCFNTTEKTSSLFGIDGNEKDVKIVKGELAICGKTYTMDFLVKEDGNAFEKLYENLGFPVSGLIGTTFMLEHNWLIDFSKQEIVLPKKDIGVPDLQSIKHNK